MSHRPREVHRLYITTEDFFVNDKVCGNVKIARGNLLSQLPEEAHPLAGKRPSLLVKVLDTEKELRVEPQGLQELSERTAALLEAVTNYEERLALLANPRQLQTLSEIRRGDWVRVQITSSSNEKVPGVVRYCGPLVKSKGILFGVELVGLAAGKGFTDGSFKGQKLFSCQENCGVFVPVSRIEPSDGAVGLEGDSVERVLPRTTSLGEDHPLALPLGTRVYYKMGDENVTGTVVFCNTLPKKEDLGIYVGIRLDKPEGNWDGYFKGTKLCNIPSPDYGIYLPIDKVYRAPSPVIQQLERRNCLARGSPDKNQQNRLARNRPKEVNRPVEDKEKSNVSWYISEPYASEGREPANLQAETQPTRAVRPLRIAGTDDIPLTSLKYPSPLDDSSPQRSPGHSSLDSPSPGGREEHRWPLLELNSMVEVQDPPIYGVIRWIGELPDFPETMAGLEVEDPMPTACTDGIFRGVRYFQCAPNKALFVKLRICRPDSRFASLHLPTNQINRCNSIAFRDYTSERVEEDTPPQGWKDGGEQLIGWKKGIQGHCNSCYLDATLFSMFAFTPVLDTMLLRPRDKNDSETYAETRDLLRTEIVNPLRKHGYVCATKVMALRRILEAAGQSSGFTSEEKDPEEFLNQLFQVLKVEPLFKIRSSGKDTHGCIFYQIFMERKQSVSVPCVQQLLEWSLVTSDLKFTEAPSCLILQMPRNGKNFKMFTTILPTLELDITDLLEDTPRECCICESLALLECKECYEDPSIAPGSIKQYCSVCSKQVHRHRQRRVHQPQCLRLPEELAHQMDFPGIIPRQTMQLFAVLCIETSHYVAFTKHGPRDTDWRFFDSMADREGGQNGFNIPQVAPCPEVAEYLSMTPDELQELDHRAMPVYARRLLCDAYMCLYHSPTLSLYK